MKRQKRDEKIKTREKRECRSEGKAVICPELYSLRGETSVGGILPDCYTHSESENEQLKTRVFLFFSFYTCFRVICGYGHFLM